MASRISTLQTESLVEGERVAPRPWFRRPYVWMAVVALVLRVGYILVAHTYLAPRVNGGLGPGEASNIARSIAVGEGFSSPFSPYGGYTGPTAWIGPVYPYLSAAAFKFFGIYGGGAVFLMLFLNSLASALTCIPIVLIAEHTVGRRVGFWAGWAWAVVPLFMRWPTSWLWEISFSALLMASIFLLALDLARTNAARSWVAFGGLWGIAALTNPALMGFLPFSLAWPAWKLRRAGKSYGRTVLWATLACVAVIAPWLIRNLLVFRTPVFIRSNFAFEMRVGNFHGSTGMGWRGLHPTNNPRQYARYRSMGELAFVEASRREVVAFIRQYPGEFAMLCMKRFAGFWDGEWLRYGPDEPWRTWMFWPLSLLALFGLLFALECRREGAWLFAMALFFYPTAYYLTYPQPRYRHAIEPLMLILAVFFFVELPRRIGRGKSTSVLRS